MNIKIPNSLDVLKVLSVSLHFNTDKWFYDIISKSMVWNIIFLPPIYVT